AGRAGRGVRRWVGQLGRGKAVRGGSRATANANAGPPASRTSSDMSLSPILARYSSRSGSWYDLSLFWICASSSLAWFHRRTSSAWGVKGFSAHDEARRPTRASHATERRATREAPRRISFARPGSDERAAALP